MLHILDNPLFRPFDPFFHATYDRYEGYEYNYDEYQRMRKQLSIHLCGYSCNVIRSLRQVQTLMDRHIDLCNKDPIDVQFLRFLADNIAPMRKSGNLKVSF